MAGRATAPRYPLDSGCFRRGPRHGDPLSARALARSNSDQPTAITNILLTTSGSSHTGEIPLGTPTCSACTRHGRWALYPNGEQVVVAWPGGALVGLPAEVAGELDRLGGNHNDVLDRGAAWAIRQFRPTPPPPTPPHGRRPGRGPGPAQPLATGSAAPLTSPATTPTSQPAGPVRQPRSCRCRCPTPARSRPRHKPPDHSPTRHASSRHIDSGPAASDPADGRLRMRLSVGFHAELRTEPMT